MTGFSPATKGIVERRSGGICECDGERQAIQMHHRCPRGRGGTRRAWVDLAANAFHICLACHNRIESRRTEARDNGWLISSNGILVADKVPLLYRRRKALLNNAGRVTYLEAA